VHDTVCIGRYVFTDTYAESARCSAEQRKLIDVGLHRPEMLHHHIIRALDKRAPLSKLRRFQRGT